MAVDWARRSMQQIAALHVSCCLCTVR